MLIIKYIESFEGIHDIEPRRRDKMLNVCSALHVPVYQPFRFGKNENL